ncbi:MAG: hypothetical protein LAT84_04900 [Balneolia bacterium]|nr:hypothetical protein [Balneolia bacterium]
MPNVRIELSKDGSHTLYSESQGSYYHNPNGAVEESIHVYFEQSGIIGALRGNKPVSVMEIGFGTGLNLLLLANLALKLESSSAVTFTSVEAYPIGFDQAQQLNYRDFLEHPELFDQMLPVFSGLNSGGEAITLQKIGPVQAVIHKCLFDDFEPGAHHPAPFTHILHDPFDPVVSPELWTPEVFARLKSLSSDEAVMVTYGASSRARAAMAVGGWFIARAPGALGKREMTVASMAETSLDGLKRLNEHRLRERWRAGDF